jgi:hypothetical protein
MARCTRVLLTSLVLLALGLGGGATWYYWLLRSTKDPLHLRIVKVESEPGGCKVVHFEVTNTSWFDLEFTGTFATSEQHPNEPLHHAFAEEFPEPGSGYCQLPARETATGSFRIWHPVSCSYHYRWEPQFELANRVYGAGRGLEGKAPDWLVRFILTSMTDVRQGATEEVLIPGGTTVPVTATTPTKPEPRAR